MEVLEEFSASSPLILPADWFKLHASRALILAEQRRNNEAAEEAMQALRAMETRHSGVPYHPSIGLVGDYDPQLRARLELIARGSEQPSHGMIGALLTGLFKRNS